MEKLWQRIFFRLTIPIVGIFLGIITVLFCIFGLIPLLIISSIIWILTANDKIEELSIIILWPTILFFYYLDWLKRNNVIKE